MKSISSAIVVLAASILILAAAILSSKYTDVDEIVIAFVVPVLFLIVATAKWWNTLDSEK